MVNDLRDPSRDMTMDRTKLQEANRLIKLIWITFEEV